MCRDGMHWRAWTRLSREERFFCSSNSSEENETMRKRLSPAALVVAVLLAIVPLILRPTQANGDENKAQPAEVKVDNFTFGPETLTVPANSTVTWINKDDVPHVIASSDGLFKSKALDTDDKYSYTFSKAGTYSYYCSIHPKMVGKIVVQ